MLKYPHTITITRPTPGVSAGSMVSGVWVPNVTATLVAVYTGVADVQDTPKVLLRDASGVPVIVSDATVFLADGVNAAIVHEEDFVTVTWEDGTTDDARVMQTRRLDDRLALQWL